MCTVGDLDEKLLTFAQRFKPEINSLDNVKIPINFKGFNTILIFNNNYTIQIQNTASPIPCLEISLGQVYTDEGYCISTIEFVTAHGECLIPKRGGGTWIMELAEYILDELQIRERELKDDAYITCDIGEINLRMLRLYQGKGSWYENFGYSNVSEPDYGLACTEYRNLFMNQVVENIDSLETSRLKRKIKQIYKILDQVDFNEEETLGQYMSRLYVINCEWYEIFENLFDESAKMYSNLVWSDLRTYIDRENNYEKLKLKF